MTRILSITLCDECPHAYAGLACDIAEVEDRVAFTVYTPGGIHEYRRFEDYPVIPNWCPLEQDGPDWRPNEGGRSS